MKKKVGFSIFGVIAISISVYVYTGKNVSENVMPKQNVSDSLAADGLLVDSVIIDSLKIDSLKRDSVK
jgi:hypothetical protein